LYREKSLGTDSLPAAFPGTATANYTCSSRRRYGNAACSAERLPADQRESEVRGALLRTIRRHDQAALAAGLARSGAQRRQHQDELGVVDAELTKSEEAIDRYFLAFEAGTLSETTCGPP
jgi:site-specific DNA recombinase